MTEILNTIESFDIELELGTIINKGGGDYPEYDGDYEITPKVTEQVLPTKDTFMTDDVTVFQIPYASVSNLSGGSTVTIGLE